MVSGILALLMFAAGPNGPEAPQRFKMDVAISQVVDLTSMGQGETTSDITGVVFFTLTMSDTTDGRLAHAVIDSMTVEATGQAGMMFSQTAADALKGEFLHGYIKNGKVEGTATPSVNDNAAMNLASPFLTAIFPGVRDGAESWSDTVSTNTSTDQANMNSQAIVDWTVTGRSGEELVLTGKGTGTVSGEQQGNQISGEVATTFAVTSVPGGPASSAVLTSSQDLLIITMQAPEPLSVKVTTRGTVTSIP
jgi:hypothetical protein